MTIDFAKTGDKPALLALWQECFGDEDEYIKAFLEHRFNPADTLVVREEGEAASVIFLLPGGVSIQGENFSALYIYAACTSERFRGRGFMSALLDAARDEGEKRGTDFICLVPAEESLFGYYARSGYVPAFEEKLLYLSRRQLKFVAAGCDSEVSFSPDAKSICSVRRAALSACDHFVWDEKAVDYALEENRLGGGRVLCSYEDGRPGAYALFYEEGEKLVIRECAARRGAFPALALALLSATECDVFFFRLPLSFPLSADKFETRHNAMLQPLNRSAQLALNDINNAYMGLTLG